VQNPARYPVKTENPMCKPKQHGDCLTPEQTLVLHAYTNALLARLDRTFGAAETKDAGHLRAFIRNDLARLTGGVFRGPADVRLFLMPGMQHCSGGVDPDHFDMLSATGAWAEHGKEPDTIPASTGPKPAAPRSLALSPHARQARYARTGMVTDATNWSRAGGGSKSAGSSMTRRSGATSADGLRSASAISTRVIDGDEPIPP
jgi:hypothetical protein